MKNTEQIGFKLPNGLLAQLKKVAKAEGRTKSAQARFFLELALTGKNREAAK